MRRLRRATVALLMLTALAAAPPSAGASEPGGAEAPAAQQAGAVQYGIPVHAASLRPVVTALSVPSGATAGRPPRVTFRIDEKGVGTVALVVAVTNLATRRLALTADMGWVHTGRTIAVVWPHGAQLAPGRYHVSLKARDHHSGSLLRSAHASGVATLTVSAPAPPVQPLEPGVPTPAQTVAMGAVFPVRGAHSFGDSENRFGAQRTGHIHQGQDVLTAEGTPVAAPLAGTIESTSFQAGGAGYYLVEHTAVGFDFMFAHCEAGSFAVRSGEAVAAGQALCLAGQTGDATAPHLHFEMWVGGWQAPGGRPIDPLAYLEAW
jgi:biotin carboxyl carrier protein